MSRAPRVCPKPGCPRFQPCDVHVRPTAHRRGYDAAHQRTRAQWQPRVRAGLVDCWRCGDRIQAGTAWDLGHDDGDRTITRGPEHMRCNRSAAGRAAHAE